MPFIGPFTGAAFLRAPDLNNVVNIRASYSAEAEAWIKHLTEDLHFTQHRDLLPGRCLRPRRPEGRQARAGKARHGTERPKAPSSATPARSVRRCGPSSEPNRKPWSWSEPMGPAPSSSSSPTRRGFHPTFVNISFVGANALARELGAEGEGVVVSQVVPFPWDSLAPGGRGLSGGERALDPTLTPDFVSLEGYLSGRLAAAALEAGRAEPDARGVAALINDVGRFDIGGTSSHSGPRRGTSRRRSFSP